MCVFLRNVFFITCDIVFAFTVSDVFSSVLYLLQSVHWIVEENVFPRTNIVSKSVLKIEVVCVLLFPYFYFLYNGSLAWRDTAPIKNCYCCFFLFTWKTSQRLDFCCWQRCTKWIQTYLPCLSLVTKQLYFTALTFKVFLFMKISLFMYYVFLQSYSIIVIGEMKCSPGRWKLHFDWTSFLMQSPINIMPSAVFLENGYRCDFWIDKKIEHLNVVGKTDGIFVLGKTPS